MVTSKHDLENVDWEEMKATLSQDKFDNGGSAEQLKASFANSSATCIIYTGDQIISIARGLSDSAALAIAQR
ncbi:hypothetical protein [Nostoc sp.]|uniref:hypothetical protein n=1 Tax=Nostoc sp. TaxID=1180 RepID=UPI002FF9D127